MRDLLTNPLSRPDDLGRPIPDDRHAVSVCLPTWADNVGYEEADPRVVRCMQSGYPRFFYHPLCREFFAECVRRSGRDGEAGLAFPSRASAELLQRFLREESREASRVEDFGANDVHVLLFPERAAATAKLGWQHLGGGASSRLADVCLREQSVPEAGDVKRTLRNRIAVLAGVAADDVYLFPCGMNAIATVHRALLTAFPDRKSIQFGFPYVDTLKLLEKVGPGAHFLQRGDDRDLQRLAERLAGEPVAGVYTEFPTNPLLISPDLERLSELARRQNCPLIVDDTISGFHNVDLLPAADVVTSSLTKSFSGVGDVTGGSVVLNPNGPFHSQIKSALEAVYEDLLFAADAVVLERNSRDYSERAPRINRTAERVAAELARRPEVERVFYPALTNPAGYDRFRKPDGGYGCLFSLVLKDAPRTTPAFFDRLQVNKGPNLGANYTLACPFTILAHYNELEFAESCGVSRWLIRVSIGLEDPDDLIARFADALSGG